MKLVLGEKKDEKVETDAITMMACKMYGYDAHRRNDIDPITPAQLAFYSMALGAVCKDPHSFYGHNLVGKSLKCKVESQRIHACKEFPRSL
jgi:hypothetical protein